MMMLSYTILVCGLVYSSLSGVYTTDGAGYELYFTDGSSYEFSPCSDLDILSTSLCPQNEAEVKKKCDCKSLCAKKIPVLECRTVGDSIPVKNILHTACAYDEVLAGCFDREDPNWNVSGSFVLPGDTCGQDQSNSVGVVRCCKIPGIQLSDCNNTCQSNITDLLSCYTKEMQGENYGDGMGVTAFCSQRETMTACIGNNIIHDDSWITEKNGTDACIISPRGSSALAFKGYVTCCRYK